MTESSDPVSASPVRPPRRRRGLVLVGAVVLVAAAAGWYLLGAGLETTDDAFIAADVHRIAAQVSGRIVAIAVRENETVAAGQLLAELDPADYDARLQAADAAVALAEAWLQEARVDVDLVTAGTAAAVAVAEAEVRAAEAQLEQAQAGLAAAAAEARRSGDDRARYEQLSDRAVTPQLRARVAADATAAAATEQEAQQRVASAAAAVAAAQARRTAAEADRGRVAVAAAAVQRRQAELAAARAQQVGARLDRSYVRITAPAAGRVTRKSVLPGTWVQPGQALMALVGTDVWVEANFKETQLRDMRPGQTATVHVDAYGLDLAARVDSVQAGAGAAFSLLPAENATGNYVKVVQRVPVKLVFRQQPDARYVLGPGMSVVPAVRVR